jgi:hypothetical protein
MLSVQACFILDMLEREIEGENACKQGICKGAYTLFTGQREREREREKRERER